MRANSTGLLVTPCDDDPHPQLVRALGRRRRRARRQQPHLDAGLHRPDDRRAVADVKPLRLGSVAVHDDGAVGEHAVDVEQDEADALGASLETLSTHH